MKQIITCSKFNCIYNTYCNKCILKIIAINDKGSCISFKDKLYDETLDDVLKNK